MYLNADLSNILCVPNPRGTGNPGATAKLMSKYRVVLMNCWGCLMISDLVCADIEHGYR